ncbi:MAG: LemA-like protein [Candidatus Berkelbacteria bacterium Licking1014_85]|uniref:LemA-like protein n=1 Tax=Candidatus Berkelbacteria bacterium Licking1014_85 TaxID=2017148 RepID=A0A554LLH0_9BACT|nr:MAG: LemA-like protein [Candidatus Berkelbacteria bacterium Licking1014_85]
MQPIYYIYIIIALILVWIVSIYNKLVTLKNRVKEAWSDITVQLKRRYDLIPNLVETVKAYAKHESSVFTEVTKARTEAMGAKSLPDKAKAENMLSETLKSIFAVAENYPQLRASENFKALQDELTDTENKIEAARRFYNTQARDLNTAREVLPNNLFVGILNIKEVEFFEVDEAEKQAVKSAPKVEF